MKLQDREIMLDRLQAIVLQKACEIQYEEGLLPDAAAILALEAIEDEFCKECPEYSAFYRVNSVKILDVVYYILDN